MTENEFRKSLTSSANALLQVTEWFGQVLDACDGYRKDCERRGYSPTAAEAMAMDLHHVLLTSSIPKSNA